MTNRVALCIGISSYTAPDISNLPNAVPDAELIHQRLIARGFDSELIVNATCGDIEGALQRLQAKSQTEPATRVFTVIYFAGHGFETGGLGFLLPTDFPGPVQLIRIPTLGLSTLHLVDAISEKSGPKLIILDACRSDAARESSSNEVTRFNELIEDVKALHPNAVNADDVVFAFATSAGAPAGDGVDGHSRYCKALASGLFSHDHSLDELLSSVAQQVIRESKMGQRPWYLSSLTYPVSFSDLPTFIPVPFEIYRPSSHQLVTRIHPVNASCLVYSIEHELLFAQGYERKTWLKFEEPIQALGIFGNDLYILFESGILAQRNANLRDRAQFAAIHQTAFKDVFAVSVSPDGCTIIIVGRAGYEVISRVGGKWSQLRKCETPGIDFYNAQFFDNDTAFLCDSSGMVGQLSRLMSWDIERFSQNAQIKIGRPAAQDIEIVDGGKMVVAVYIDGSVTFFDRSTLKPVSTFSVNGLVLNVAHDYANLRNQFTQVEVELYFRDRAAFASLFPDDPEIIGNVDAQVGLQRLLSCTLLKDTRVLAVASEEGFVFLFDVRDHKHFRTIDVGGGLGKSLRWMCADLDSNAFIVLLSDGTMVRYEGVMPQY